LAEASLISDELLRRLMAVGQVDILVGIPTLNNAASIGQVVRAVHMSFATHFRRERTFLLNCDGGSDDATCDIVRESSLNEGETLTSQASLRTVHRVSAPYHGLPGKGSALQTLFAVAELVQARAIAVFDPDVTSLTPEWVARLVGPAFRGQADFVAPVFARHPRDGLLVTQVVRPMFRAAYGRRVSEPLAAEFACSGTFAARCLGDPVWSQPFARYGIDLWLTGTALAEGFRCAQAPLGPRLISPSAVRPALPEVFRQVVSALFDCLELHSSYWLPRSGSEPLPQIGSDGGPDPTPQSVDAAPLLESFRSGMRDLAPLLPSLLDPETVSALQAAAAADEADFRLPDALWARTLWQAAAAHHGNVIHRDHVVRALVPLYLGRAASFLMEDARQDAAGMTERLEELCQELEQTKPELVTAWAPEKVR
jgi:glucosylglycerate synthase